MKSTTPIKITVESLPVVIATNPEYCDMGNPNGEVIREKFYVYAELNGGEMYGHDMGLDEYEAEDYFHPVSFMKGWDTREDAETQAEKIQTSVDNGVELNELYWVYDRVSYGSEAYQKNGRGERELIEWEDRHKDD
jgi:hypothetical protein